MGLKSVSNEEMNDSTETQKAQAFGLKDRLEWYWLVCADPDLPASAKLVASRLALYHCNSKTGQCNPSAKTLADALGRHARGIDPALKALKKAGWISWKTKTGASNAYRLERVPTSSTTTETVDAAPAPMQPAADIHADRPMASTTEGVCSPLQRGGMQSTAEKPGRFESGREPVISLPSSTARAARAGERPGASGGVRKTGQTPLPTDFDLTPERESIAMQAGIRPEDISSLFQRFTTHAAANGRQYVDWNEAWRGWCLNAVDRQKPNQATTETGRQMTSRFQVPRSMMR